MSFHPARPARPAPLVPLLLLLLGAPLPFHRAVQEEAFDKAEFAARRARLLEKIGDGVAVVVAGEEHIYNVRFRQSPDFYYLTGVEQPGAVLLLNGVTKNVAVFAGQGSGLRDDTRLGARGDGFLPIVPSGPNAPDVHYDRNSRQMQAGELVYIDYGSDYAYYTSDITRVWPVSGRFTADQEKMYRCVLEARDAIIAAMKPEITLRQMKEAAAPVYQKYGWLDAYNQSGRYIGHFVGLSVHDVGGISGSWLDRPMAAGVVFNVEPILQFPQRGIHLRLEDTILITESGAENLTAGVPAAVEPLLALVKEEGVNDQLNPGSRMGAGAPR